MDLWPRHGARAARARGLRAAARHRLRPAAPGPGMLLLRVAACGVCRTDLQLCEGDSPPHKLPVVPGHQIVGRVEAVGAGVDGWRVGDRAGVAWLAGADGTCEQVPRWAREPLRARDVHRMGRRRRLRRRTPPCAPTSRCALPDGFDDLAAAPLLCGGVIGYRSLERQRHPAGRPARPLRLRRLGAARDPDRAPLGLPRLRRARAPAEQERARALGAEWAGGYDDRRPSRSTRRSRSRRRATSCSPRCARVDRGGTVAINAIHLDRVPELPYDDLWWERRLASVANFTRADATRVPRARREDPDRTSFETHPLADANLALARLARGEVRGAAVLVRDGR